MKFDTENRRNVAGGRLRFLALGRSRLGRFLTLAAFPLFIGSCGAFAPSESDLPVGSVRFAPPAQYAEWFAKTEACSGISGDAQAIAWYVVPGAETFETEAGRKVGMWERDKSGARIVLAGNYENSEMAVRHEMLHHLLDRTGHPPEYFVTRCHLTWETWTGPNAARAQLSVDH
ncbi:MAG: hypothetical protein ABI647_10800 [Gemmatimonadota bacterium]